MKNLKNKKLNLENLCVYIPKDKTVWYLKEKISSIKKFKKFISNILRCKENEINFLNFNQISKLNNIQEYKSFNNILLFYSEEIINQNPWQYNYFLSNLMQRDIYLQENLFVFIDKEQFFGNKGLSKKAFEEIIEDMTSFISSNNYNKEEEINIPRAKCGLVNITLYPLTPFEQILLEPEEIDNFYNENLVNKFDKKFIFDNCIDLSNQNNNISLYFKDNTLVINENNTKLYYFMTPFNSEYPPFKIKEDKIKN